MAGEKGDSISPRLSVIIPCYNAAGTIGAQLEALAAQHWAEPWEVIISDNGSTDDSLVVVERCKTRIPNLRVVDASDRKGASHARNIGAQAARAEALAFCDADDVVAPGWVSGMGEALAKYDFVACRVDIAKLNPPWLQKALPNAQGEKLQKLWFLPHRLIAGAGTLGVKQVVHKAVGGFDESWEFLEDPDYCLRIQRTGVELHFVPDALLHLRYRQTCAQIYRQARAYAPYSIRLFKTHRPIGRYRWWWKWYLIEWKRLARLARGLRGKTGRALWAWNLGWQIGRLQGSLKYMVPPVPFP